MTERTPATSLIAALDTPWRFLRTEFSSWAPPAFGIAAIGIIPGLLTAWANANLQMDPGAEPNFAALAGVYAGACSTGFVSIALMFGAFTIVYRIVEGQPVGILDVLMGAFSPRMLLAGGVAMGLVFVGFGCVVGGPLVAAVFGFVPAVLVSTPGRWFGGWITSVELASRRVGPKDAGAPAWKLAAIYAVWYALMSAMNQFVVIPNFGWMIWHLVTTLGAGDVQAALQLQPPFPVGAATALLGALFKPFADVYLAAGTLLLLRDLARVRRGADLEALVEAGAP
jgi:hypothetical protein